MFMINLDLFFGYDKGCPTKHASLLFIVFNKLSFVSGNDDKLAYFDLHG